jgi:peptidoglycan/xylan/chitin deacetylase (PgdA/CDA1 family)
MIVGRLARRIRRLAMRGSGATILMYHRVAAPRRDPQLLCVHPERFEQHLQVLRRHWRVVPLARLVEELAVGRMPPRTVCVTFDDGYADNVEVAAPLLRANDVPATIFVTAGLVSASRPFLWWDELESLMLGSATLPTEIDLEVGAQRKAVRPGPPGGSDRWNVLLPDASPRQRAYLELHAALRGCGSGERGHAIDQLRLAAGGDGEPPAAVMTEEQLAVLPADGLIEIGGHTLSHPVLSSLAPDEQRREVVGSKQRLEEIVGRRVESFAYPYGGRSDYDSHTLAAVREASFRRACSTVAERASPGADPLQLPRFCVRDWDGDAFTRQLSAWAAGD